MEFTSMKYKIHSGTNTEEFIKDINGFFEQGWRPIGGPFWTGKGVGQALILVEPEPEPEKPTTQELVRSAMADMMNDPEMQPKGGLTSN